MDELDSGREPFGHLDEDYLAYLFLGQQAAPQTPTQPPTSAVTASAAFEQQELLEELERHFDIDLEFDLADLLCDDGAGGGGEGPIGLPHRKQRRFAESADHEGDSGSSTPLLPNVELGQESPVGNDSPSFTSSSSSSQFPMLPFLPPEFFNLYAPPPRTPPPAAAAATTSFSLMMPYSCPPPSASLLELAPPAPSRAAIQVPVLQGSVSNGAGVQRHVLRLDEKSVEHVVVATTLRPGASTKAVSDGNEVGKIHDMMMARRKVKGVRRSKMATSAVQRTAVVGTDRHATHHLASALSAMSVGTTSAATTTRYQRPFHFSAPPLPPSGTGQ